MSDPDGKKGRFERRDVILALLAFASGVTDVLSFLGLHAVFTSAMTGNAALLGLEAGQGRFDAAARSCAALAGFVAGVAAATLLQRPELQRSNRRRVLFASWRWRRRS